MKDFNEEYKMRFIIVEEFDSTNKYKYMSKKMVLK